MTKTELISAIAEKTELTKKDSAKALDAITATITETLAAGGKVQLVGFGTFESRARAARTGITPRQRSRSRQQRFPLSRLVRVLRTQLLSKQQRLCPTIWHSAV